MKKLLLLKILIKNFFRLNPSYAYLLISNKIQNKSKKIIKKNIFIVTSCINVNDVFGVHIHNLKHGVETRFTESIAGLKSIRSFYKDAYIIFLESSKLLPDYESEVKILVDEYYNYCEINSIYLARKHFNKGVPQFTALVKFIEENQHNYSADIFHFLGARYSLTVNNTENRSMLSGAYFLYYPSHKNVSTRYFFFKKMHLSTLATAFRKTLYCAIVGGSVEDFIQCFFSVNYSLKELGVTGVVNGVETIFE